jgi:peptide/nickel transport system substrate-binding protein
LIFSELRGLPPRYTRYQNDAFDDLYEASIQQTDLGKRTTLYHEMNQIIVEDAPIVFLFYDESALFTTKNVVNIETNGINLLQVKQLKEQDAE